MNSYNLSAPDVITIAFICALVFIPLGWYLRSSRAKLSVLVRILFQLSHYKDEGTLGELIEGRGKWRTKSRQKTDLRARDSTK